MPRNNATVAPFSSLAAALRVLAMSCVLALVFGASNARATTDWQSGDLVSYNQAAWVILPQASATLTNNFSAVYPPFGVVEIGVPGRLCDRRPVDRRDLCDVRTARTAGLDLANREHRHAPSEP